MHLITAAAMACSWCVCSLAKDQPSVDRQGRAQTCTAWLLCLQGSEARSQVLSCHEPFNMQSLHQAAQAHAAMKRPRLQVPQMTATVGSAGLLQAQNALQHLAAAAAAGGPNAPSMPLQQLQAMQAAAAAAQQQQFQQQQQQQQPALPAQPIRLVSSVQPEQLHGCVL
jgi:hypothetical protein